jgi:hypothetical protein
MSRAHRFATPAVLLALVLVVSTGAGCGGVDPALIDPDALPEHVNVLRVQLPSLDEDLDGIWLHRRSEITGEFEPISEIRLTGRVSEEGAEFVEYELLDPSGVSIGLTLSAQVDRSGPAPELALWIVRFSEPGEFKASVYNQAGESSLSEQTITL